MKTKSPLPWFGSDAAVAPRLAALLDHCSHVTIPFCGGLSILPNLKARAIVANDAHSSAINFYRKMCDPDDRYRLIEMCENTLSHPAELRYAEKIVNDPWHDSLLHAWAFWAICWIGRKGKGGTKHQGGMPSVRRTGRGGTNASRIAAAASDLREWAQEFKRCEWEQVDFRQVLEKVSEQKGCGIYCDPPWFKAGRNYLHKFGTQDHEDLKMLLERFKQTTIVVRYDNCDQARELYADWTVIEAGSRSQSNGGVEEVWFVKNLLGK